MLHGGGSFLSDGGSFLSVVLHRNGSWFYFQGLGVHHFLFSWRAVLRHSRPAQASHSLREGYTHGNKRETYGIDGTQTHAQRERREGMYIYTGIIIGGLEGSMDG